MMSSLAQAEAQENEQNSTSENSSSNSSSSFPLARVKKIMKADKDVNLVSAEAVHLTSIASVGFLIDKLLFIFELFFGIFRNYFWNSL